MRCHVEITDSAPREEYRRPVSYHDFAESGEGRPASAVKVTGLQAQRKVWTGGEVPVYVTVTNYLDHEKVANVVLQDCTKNVLIGERELIIPAQTAKTLTFYWKTRGFSLGEHVLHAEAISDPEPYYEYDRISSSRIDRDESYPAPRRDRELQGIISEAEEILSRVDREWEEASQVRDRATAEADRIIDEADEQAYEERRQAQRDAEARARAILDDASQQAEGILDDAEAIKRRAEDYRMQIETQASEHSTEMWEKLRQKAEGEAQQIRDQAVRDAEELMEEVRRQLEAAKAIRELAKELSGIATDDEIDLPADEPVTEAPTDETPSTDEEPPSDDTPPADDGMLPKNPGGFVGFYQRHRPAAAAEPATDETETEDTAEAGPQAEPENQTEPETENTAGSEAATAPETGLIVVPEPSPRLRWGWSWRWYHAVIALALVAAAVMLSVGVISLG